MKDRSLLFMCSDAGFSSAISNLPIKLIIVKFITMHLMDIIFFFLSFFWNSEDNSYITNDHQNTEVFNGHKDINP